MSAATRSGLLFGVFAFFSSLGLGVLFPLCAPLCGVVWGIGAGLVANVWDDPEDEKSAPARGGAIAGGLAGVGALLGLLIGMIIQYLTVGQELSRALTAGLSSELGYDVLPSEYESSAEWIAVCSIAGCLGLANLAIMASAGAGGAAIYASRHHGSVSNEAI